MTKAIDAFFSSQRSLKAVLDYVMVNDILLMENFGLLWLKPLLLSCLRVNHCKTDKIYINVNKVMRTTVRNKY